MDDACATVVANDGDVILLEPEAAYSVELDLSDPRWHVGAGDDIGEIGRLAEFDQFRFVYRSPDDAVVPTLSAADRIWPGYLPT